MNKYSVYIMGNISKSSLYIGVTNNLYRRAYEHKKGLIDGFTARYNCKLLLYCEECSDIHSAIAREKQLKKWSRMKKNRLIERVNPGLVDLAKDWYEQA